MYDSIYISGTCQGCKTAWKNWEFQTKAGDCELEGWTIGSKTTLPVGDTEMIEDAWCLTCAYAPMTENDRIRNALEDYPMTEHQVDGKVCIKIGNHPETYVRFLLKDSIFLGAEFLEMCPSCQGRKSFLLPTSAACQACNGMGHTGKVVERGAACPAKVHRGALADATPESIQAGIEMIKSLGLKKP